MLITRRSFLGIILACGVAPAIVKASSLMRINSSIILPKIIRVSPPMEIGPTMDIGKIWEFKNTNKDHPFDVEIAGGDFFRVDPGTGVTMVRGPAGFVPIGVGAYG